jgi:hypothetical protein
MASSKSNFWKGFTVFYAIYAGAIIWLLWRHHATAAAEDFTFKAMLALWCAALVTVLLKVRWSQWVALAAFAPVIGWLLFLSVRRMAFIVEHGGMDCDTCDGSPMAFLLGWIFEAAFLIPGIFVCFWLLRAKWDRVEPSS